MLVQHHGGNRQRSELLNVKADLEQSLAGSSSIARGLPFSGNKAEL
jgi:hypothetical protein